MARELGGEVVSCDSVRVTREWTLAPQGRRRRCWCAPFDRRPEPVDRSTWLVVACARLHRRHRLRGNLPVLAGGTGLYISALLDNIRFEEIEADPAVRKALQRRAEEEGNASLLCELRQLDPETAAGLHENNLGRIIRALEVYKTTGITMSEHRRRSRLEPSPYNPCMIGLAFADRQKLYSRIDQRVDVMLEQGLVDEALRFMQTYQDAGTARQAIGYKELFSYFRGEQTLEQAVDTIKRETRRYAKRQITWFRRDPRIQWIYVDTCSGVEEIYEKSLKCVANHGIIW
ncbi:MAG: tRNA (adenosine(37)-N6)-dimethylallyltransferase MiaA [Oscillospiraceae bacterium]